MTKTLIMAVPWHPQRTARAVRLMREAGEAETTIVWDEVHDHNDTWQRTMHAAGQDPVIVLEDDVELAEHWRERVEHAITEHPDLVIQFFSMRKADLEVGTRLEPGRSFMMNQCFYLPAGAAAAVLEFFQSTWSKEHPGDNGTDSCMAAWLARQKQKYLVHVPSLVQHEQWTSQIDSRRSSKRQSVTFAKESHDHHRQPSSSELFPDAGSR